MKVTYYELLTKMLNGEPIKKVKYFDCIYTFNGRSYINSDGKYIIPLDIDAISVKNIEIIEESKEELEEIELLRDEVHFLGVNLKVNEIIFKDKINELIANQNKQNKIIRELKANKKQ